MDDAVLNGFLVAVFTVHLGVFAGFYSKRRQATHLALCGTFLALTAIYALKLAEAEPVVAGMGVQTGLRVAALSCTGIYLALRLRAWRRKV